MAKMLTEMLTKMFHRILHRIKYQFQLESESSENLIQWFIVIIISNNDIKYLKQQKHTLRIIKLLKYCIEYYAETKVMIY